jgi:hypothetical protein
MSTISAGTTTTTALVQTGDTTGNLVLATGSVPTTALTLNSTTQAATFAGTLATSSRGITAASVPAGSVIQVVQGTSTSQPTWTNSTFTDTGLSATITPQFSTSKILVLVTQRAYSPPGNSYGAVQLFRGATSLLTYNRLCLRDATSPGADQEWNTIYLDSPATTSATTYKTQAANTASNGTFYIGLDGNLQTITLMEIAV